MNRDKERKTEEEEEGTIEAKRREREERTYKEEREKYISERGKDREDERRERGKDREEKGRREGTKWRRKKEQKRYIRWTNSKDKMSLLSKNVLGIYQMYHLNKSLKVSPCGTNCTANPIARTKCSRYKV